MTIKYTDKITFGDLSADLKTLVVLGWIISGLYGLAFLFGFLSVLAW